MLHHTRPQSHLAAHRGLGTSTLTHVFMATVTRRKTLGGNAPGAVRGGGRRRALNRQLRLA